MPKIIAILRYMQNVSRFILIFFIFFYFFSWFKVQNSVYAIANYYIRIWKQF